MKTLFIYIEDLYQDFLYREFIDDEPFYYDTFSEMLFDDESDINKRVDLVVLQFKTEKSLEEK